MGLADVAGTVHIADIDCPDLVAMAAVIPRETLFIRNEEEPVDLYPAGDAAASTPPAVTIEIPAAGGRNYAAAQSSYLPRSWRG